MPTIFVSPQTTDEDATTPEVVGLEVTVLPEDWAGFNLLEVWRSRSGQGGPFEELTGATATPARVPLNAKDPPTVVQTGPLTNIVGKTLRVLANESTELEITFTGSNPLTYAQVAQQITAQGQGVLTAYVDQIGALVVASLRVGLMSRIKIEEGDAASLLSLYTEDWAYGHDARLPLFYQQNAYSITDYFGSRDYFYRTRFRNAQSGATSSMSTTYAADSVVGLPTDSMVLGRLVLVDINGKPMVSREVRVANSFKGLVIGNKVVAGSSEVKKTDRNGLVEFLLVRGQQVTVAIDGTSLVKDVIPPTDQTVTIFNLLDPNLGPQQDYFRVRVPQLAVADRRNL